MALLRKICLALLVVIAAALAALYLILRRSLPQTTGQIFLDTPYLEKPVTIVRDKMAVPHIYADSDEAAVFALGYAHAQVIGCNWYNLLGAGSNVQHGCDA